MKLNAYFKDALYWILGSLIYSVAVVSLLTPNKISVGGFTGAKNQMLFVAVRKHEAAMLLRLVMEIDSNAFAVVADAGEIIGEGFKKY